MLLVACMLSCSNSVRTLHLWYIMDEAQAAGQALPLFCLTLLLPHRKRPTVVWLCSLAELLLLVLKGEATIGDVLGLHLELTTTYPALPNGSRLNIQDLAGHYIDKLIHYSNNDTIITWLSQGLMLKAQSIVMSSVWRPMHGMLSCYAVIGAVYRGAIDPCQSWFNWLSKWAMRGIGQWNLWRLIVQLSNKKLQMIVSHTVFLLMEGIHVIATSLFQWVVKY